MRKISNDNKKIIASSDYYKKCARKEIFHDHECQGRITIEHAFIYAGRQVDELWAMVPICAWSHDVDEFQDGGNLDKEKNEYCALIMMTDEDRAKYPRFNWLQKLQYLSHKFDLSTGLSHEKVDSM